MTYRLFELDAFRHEQGPCWTSPLPPDCPTGDTKRGQGTSALILFEDGRELGPRAAAHDRIRETGQGAYSHWGRDVWFSASDNTNPSENRRRYFAVVIEGARGNFAATGLNTHEAPVNFRRNVPTTESVEADARYAITVARSYVDALPGGLAFLQGRSLLELGPGHNLGSSLVLLCWGAARVGVADRFLVPFDAEYHVPVYERLRQLLRDDGSTTDVTPIDECLALRAHRLPRLSLHASALESLSDVVDATFDVTVSNAVFEHLFDPKQAIRSLFALTAPGGIGLHQVDFRDHRNFDAPLEFLLQDELTFAQEFQARFGEMGNRLRPQQLAALIADAGFCDVRFECGLIVEQSYFDAFYARLREERASTFSHFPAEQLKPLDGRFVFRMAPALERVTHAHT